MSTAQIPSHSSLRPASSSSYNIPLGYLKASIVVLVVAHHASLAYHPAAQPIQASLLIRPRTWETYPIVDSHAIWAALFATFNDVFFMALMFFVSGLFVWKSYSRKGPEAYLRDRLLRLGVPFIPAALILSPLAYYPAYLETTAHSGFAGFLRQWAALGMWSAGPVWFCWVLLVFDVIAIRLFRSSPGLIGKITAMAGRLGEDPMRLFGVLVGSSAAVYVPVALLVGPFSWAVAGPFGFQVSRFLLYFIYFIAGIGLGKWGLDRGLLAPRGELATHWLVWIRWTVLAFIAFAVSLQAAVSRGPQPSLLKGISSWFWVLAVVLLPVSCAASSFACLGACLRWFATRFDFMESLSRSAYGIFILHFMFVSWFGYVLLATSLPSFVKFLIVTSGAVACSWVLTAGLRRIPGMQRVL